MGVVAGRQELFVTSLGKDGDNVMMIRWTRDRDRDEIDCLGLASGIRMPMRVRPDSDSDSVGFLQLSSSLALFSMHKNKI